MTHILRVTTAYPDGFSDTWATEQPGDALTAHEDLYRRWKAAGFVFASESTDDGWRQTRGRSAPEPHIEVVEHVRAAS